MTPERIKAIRAQHQRSPAKGDRCMQDGLPWPCATVELLWELERVQESATVMLEVITGELPRVVGDRDGLIDLIIAHIDRQDLAFVLRKALVRMAIRPEALLRLDAKHFDPGMAARE